jgi:hypothetical protein
LDVAGAVPGAGIKTYSKFKKIEFWMWAGAVPGAGVKTYSKFKKIEFWMWRGGFLRAAVARGNVHRSRARAQPPGGAIRN